MGTAKRLGNNLQILFKYFSLQSPEFYFTILIYLAKYPSKTTRRFQFEPVLFRF